MNHYEEVEVPATTRRTLVRTTCDRCGAEITEGDLYSANENTVSVVRGESYPESGCGTRADVDLCDPCALALLDWVAEGSGKAVEWREWDR